MPTRALEQMKIDVRCGIIDVIWATRQIDSIHLRLTSIEKKKMKSVIERQSIFMRNFIGRDTSFHFSSDKKMFNDSPMESRRMEKREKEENVDISHKDSIRKMTTQQVKRRTKRRIVFFWPKIFVSFCFV